MCGMLLKSSPALHPRAAVLRTRWPPNTVRTFRQCSRYSTSTLPPEKPTPTSSTDIPPPDEVKSTSPDIVQEVQPEPQNKQDVKLEQDTFQSPLLGAPSDYSSPPPPNNKQLEDLKESIRGWTETTATAIRKHADHYTARAAVRFAQLGKELNKVTGYGEIDILKRRVVEQEARIGTARHAARHAKDEYSKAVIQRANSQRDVNDLLGRKSNWKDEDVSRFTALVRQDHLFEQEEARAKAAAEQTEGEVEREFTELMRVILNRYHEEQIWSDKIRSASTYGSLTVLGLNLVVFIMAILFVEPWKRRRLAQTFEKKVEEMSSQTLAAYDEKTESIVDHMKKQDELIAQVIETLHAATQPPPPVELVIDPEELPLAVSLGDEGNVPPTPENVEPAPPAPPISIWDTEIPLAVATAATVSAIVGWVARSWYGR